MKGVSVEEAGSKAVKGLAMCWIFRKRSFSLSGRFIKLYSDAITLTSNSNKMSLGYKHLDGSGALLAITRWRVIGFIESEVVRWQTFQRIDNKIMAELMGEEGFRFREFQIL